MCDALPRGSAGFRLTTFSARYTQRQLYELVADTTSYPRFLPFCTNARLLGKHQGRPDVPGRTTTDVELTVGFMSFTETYVSTVTCRPYESVEVSRLRSAHSYGTC